MKKGAWKYAPFCFLGMGYPLVSCLTPTYNRRAFFPRAVERFLAQDYPNLEWIVLDDYNADPIKDLLPNDPRIKYFHEGLRASHGTKMNRCMELAGGDLAIVWDDDDWYSPNRVTRQMQPMIDNPAIRVTGTSTLYYYQHGTNQAYRYTSPKAIGWLASIAFRRNAWLLHPFDNRPMGADYEFQKKEQPNAKHDLHDPSLVVASIHGSNACAKHIGRDYASVPWTAIQQLTGWA